MNVYFPLEIIAGNFVIFFKKIPILTTTLKIRRHACVEGLTFFWSFLYQCNKCPSFKMNNNVESGLVLPSSFIIHNLGFSVNLSKDVSPKRPCWSDPAPSPHTSPLWQLWLSLLTTIQSLYIVHSQVFEHLTTVNRTRGWRPDGNRGVVPERVSTMVDRMRASASM